MKFLKILTLSVISLILANAAQAQEQVGVIKAFLVKGDVQIMNNATGATSPLKRGMEFGQGNTIITGTNSTALLLFSNGASVNVTPESKLNVSEFQQEAFDPAMGSFLRLEKDPSLSKTTTNLEYGEIIGEVRKLALEKGSSFTVNTPVASAGIRGTVWVISYNVQTGRFSATNVTGDVVVMVNGQTISVPAGEAYVIVNLVGNLEDADPQVLQQAQNFMVVVSQTDAVIVPSTNPNNVQTSIIIGAGETASESNPVGN